MEIGNSSIPTRTVAPVVVRPDIDSKNASVTDIAGSVDMSSGREPKLARTVQNRTTMTKPSRIRRSSCRWRVTNQKVKPVARVTIKANRNGVWVPSADKMATAVGGSREMLNRDSSTPMIFMITCGRMGIKSPSRSDVGDRHLKQFLDVRDMLLVNHEHDDMIFGFDHSILAGSDYFFISKNNA